MKRRWMACLLGAGFVAGCTPVRSVHPLQDPAKEVFDSGYLGEWREASQDSNDKSRFLVARGASGGYQVTIEDPSEDVRWVFECHLVRLGGRLFGDAIMTSYFVHGSDTNDPIGLLMPVHFFGRVTQLGEKVTLAGPSEDWVEKAIKQKKVHLAIESTNDASGWKFVITSPTADLLKFAEQIRDDTDAFSEKLEVIRVIAPGSGKPGPAR